MSDTTATKEKKSGELFRGDNTARITKIEAEIEARKAKIALIKAKTDGTKSKRELAAEHKKVKEEKKRVEFPRTENVTDDIFNYWKSQEKKGDIKLLVVALEKSLPTIDRALFCGHCKSDETRDAITAWFKKRNAEARGPKGQFKKRES